MAVAQRSGRSYASPRHGADALKRAAHSRALAEDVARHAPDRVTEAMDGALAEIGERADQFVRVASRRVLKRSDW